MSRLFSFGRIACPIMLTAVFFLTALFLFSGILEAADAAKEEPAQRTGASIRIDPSAVARNGQMTVTGAGFLPEEEVSLAISADFTRKPSQEQFGAQRGVEIRENRQTRRSEPNVVIRSCRLPRRRCG